MNTHTHTDTDIYVNAHTHIHIRISLRHMKRCPITLIKETEVETTWRCYFSPIRLTKLNSLKSRSWLGNGETGTHAERDTAASRAQAEEVPTEGHSGPESEAVSKGHRSQLQGSHRPNLGQVEHQK